MWKEYWRVQPFAPGGTDKEARFGSLYDFLGNVWYDPKKERGYLSDFPQTTVTDPDTGQAAGIKFNNLERAVDYFVDAVKKDPEARAMPDVLSPDGKFDEMKARGVIRTFLTLKEMQRESVIAKDTPTEQPLTNTTDIVEMINEDWPGNFEKSGLKPETALTVFRSIENNVKRAETAISRIQESGVFDEKIDRLITRFFAGIKRWTREGTLGDHSVELKNWTDQLEQYVNSSNVPKMMERIKSYKRN